MSGFDVDWLTLREPADRAARHAGLKAHVLDGLRRGTTPALVVDLGCGTGSTVRAFAPMARKLRWRLVDNDPALLAEAQRRLDKVADIELVEADLGDMPSGLFEGAAMVTASALFDLVSQPFLDRFADAIAGCGVGLYAALNYDGRCIWDIAHAMDEAVVAAFNRHQRTDKGLGEALGPTAIAAMQKAFSARGYQVLTADSPWVLGREAADLQRRFILGMAGAVDAAGEIAGDDLTTWRDMRLALCDRATCEVGHRDLLAIHV